VRVRDLPARLNCSPGAVHSLLDAVYKALDVHSLESAVARWLELQSA
jgi:hypothetical protein